MHWFGWWLHHLRYGNHFYKGLILQLFFEGGLGVVAPMAVVKTNGTILGSPPIGFLFLVVGLVAVRWGSLRGRGCPAGTPSPSRAWLRPGRLLRCCGLRTPKKWAPTVHRLPRFQEETPKKSVRSAQKGTTRLHLLV